MVEDADVVKSWLNEQRSERTRTEYQADAAAYLAWLNGRRLADVTLPMAGEYAAHLRGAPARAGRKLSEATQARRLSSASSLHRYLVRIGQATGNPYGDMPRPVVSKAGRTPARTQADVVAIYRATRGRDSLVMGLLATSGLRVSELCNADSRALGHDGAYRVLIVRTKGGGSRNVVLQPFLIGHLDDYLDGRVTGPLLLGDDGCRLTRDKVTTILRRAARAAGVTDPGLVRPHVLRASAITNLLEDGTPIQDVQAMVGHASPDTTARYWRRRAGITRDDKLGARLSVGFAVDNQGDVTGAA